jgi:hypothetical protein
MAESLNRIILNTKNSQVMLMGLLLINVSFLQNSNYPMLNLIISTAMLVIFVWYKKAEIAGGHLENVQGLI